MPVLHLLKINVYCVVVISGIVYVLYSLFLKFQSLTGSYITSVFLTVILDYFSLCISLHNHLIFFTTIGPSIPNIIGNETDWRKLGILKLHA